ncbi:molecular chaperone TorD family protein [Bacillus sp. FJAT-27251]|uniref:TorD/DmsD family molecular chaperone n=1 Tax=Bacillus sp. FJAT-27251 TaxID=1684142 RepID=UPI0006A7AB13|nr:molecular chaperone TorD family protein [Bacillus sp. FJAT-27251]
MVEPCVSREGRMLFYQLFLHYYRGDLNQLNVGQWKELVQLLKAEPACSQNPAIQEALGKLEKMDENPLTTLLYDYNRLFIGPSILLASPYESSYENAEGSVMQGETMKVRNFYYHEGLQVAEEGTIPDDHIQFEIEFMIHLLGCKPNEEKEKVETLFLQNHLLKWGPKHCEKVEQHSQNEITLAMGLLLKGFLETERMFIKGGDYDVN